LHKYLLQQKQSQQSDFEQGGIFLPGKIIKSAGKRIKSHCLGKNATI
jgi:hypothetical protein